MNEPKRIDAQWARDRFSAALEGELPDEERDRFQRALQGDPELAEEFVRFQEAMQALRDLRHAPLPPPPDLVVGVRERLRARRPARYRRRPLPWGTNPWMPVAMLLAVLGLAAIAFALWQAARGGP